MSARSSRRSGESPATRRPSALKRALSRSMSAAAPNFSAKRRSLAARGGALLQVDEVHGDAALLEEALRLARLWQSVKPKIWA